MTCAQWRFLIQLDSPHQKHIAEGVTSEEVVGVEEESMIAKVLCCNLLKQYRNLRLR